MSAGETYVFGYGSLVDEINEPGVRIARLNGSMRTWNVAMDNSVDIPGYRYFVDPETKERPAVFVTFLNIILAETAETSTNGLLIPVSVNLLKELDEQEHNYDRVDVTERLDSLPRHSRVYAYIGKEAATSRFNSAPTGAAVINQHYNDIVEEGFAALGAAQLEAYHRTTVPHNLPIIPLEEVRL